MNLLIIFCHLPAGLRGGTAPRLGRSARQFQAPIESHDFPCGRAGRSLRLLSPPVVVGMGGAGWRAVRRVFGLDATPRLISHAADSCWIRATRKYSPSAIAARSA